MSDATISTIQYEMKEFYIMNDPVNLTYDAGPAWAMLEKTPWSGYQLPIPQTYANPMGGSSTYSYAASSSNSIQGARFIIPAYASYYDLGTIQENVIAATRNDRGAWIEAMTLQINGSLRSHGTILSIYLYGDGSGALAQVASVSGTTVTLVDQSTVYRFSVGMQCVSDNETFPSSVATNVQTITAIDQQNGTITFGTLPTGTTTDWYIFRAGDCVASGVGALLAGFAAWVPVQSTVDLTTAFYGVDRSVDSAKLAGVNVNAAGLSVVQAIIQLSQSIFVNGGKPDKAFMHPYLYAQLLQDLQNKSIYQHSQGEDRMEDAKVSFSKVTLNTGFGLISIYQDRWCDSTLIYMFDWDKWSFYNYTIADMYTSDGMYVLRVSDDDAVQYRIRTYGQLGCRAVGFQGVAYGLQSSAIA